MGQSSLTLKDVQILNDFVWWASEPSSSYWFRVVPNFNTTPNKVRFRLVSTGIFRTWKGDVWWQSWLAGVLRQVDVLHMVWWGPSQVTSYIHQLFNDYFSHIQGIIPCKKTASLQALCQQGFFQTDWAQATPENRLPPTLPWLSILVPRAPLNKGWLDSSSHTTWVI